MLRACCLSSFMLLLTTTTFLVCDVSAAKIANIGIKEKFSTSLSRQSKPVKLLATKTPLPNQTTLIEPTTIEHREYNDHPAVVMKPRLIERYDKRALDGHYEYRYVLSNGDVRYERAYWLPVGNNKKILARKGYYSYPLPNHRYHTVFYTADHNGFHEIESTVSRMQPLLPRSLETNNSGGENDSITAEVAQTEQKQKSKQKQKQNQRQTNKINGKPNWEPTTKSILQKGRIIANVAEQKTGTEAISRTTRTILNEKRGRTSAAIAVTAAAAIATTAVSVDTNRPQINKEKATALEPNANANAISVPSEMRISSSLSSSSLLPVDDAAALAMDNISSSSSSTSFSTSMAKSETINSIKAESVQTTAAAVETKTEQLATVDTTARARAKATATTSIEAVTEVATATVLSVD